MNFQRSMKISVLIFLLRYSSIAYAHDDQHQDIIDMVLKHARSSIKKFDENRIVFHPEKTCLYNGMIYVEGENGEAIDLSSVHEHLFYEDSTISFWQSKERIIYYICSKCTWGMKQSSTQNSPLKCPKCHHTPLLIRYQ